MSRLDEATQRLERAVARLENAATAESASENADDRHLREELSAARKEHAELQAVTRDVSVRLDTAIARLKTILEG
jgi:hypothetical protein